MRGILHFAALAVVLATISVLPEAAQSSPSGNEKTAADLEWSELMRSMDKMHADMTLVGRSGEGDIDFVRLMLPHHQAAIDMAKAQLAYGKDPQIRRLAQEIITDQQSEIELMQLWLKHHEAGSLKSNRLTSRP